MRKPIRPLLYNIKAIVYKNDKIFDTKLFEDFEKFDFWIMQMKKIWKERLKNNYQKNYNDLTQFDSILDNNTIIKIYQLFANNKELLLST